MEHQRPISKTYKIKVRLVELEFGCDNEKYEFSSSQPIDVELSDTKFVTLRKCQMNIYPPECKVLTDIGSSIEIKGLINTEEIEDVMEIHKTSTYEKMFDWVEDDKIKTLMTQKCPYFLRKIKFVTTDNKLIEVYWPAFLSVKESIRKPVKVDDIQLNDLMTEETIERNFLTNYPWILWVI